MITSFSQLLLQGWYSNICLPLAVRLRHFFLFSKNSSNIFCYFFFSKSSLLQVSLSCSASTAEAWPAPNRNNNHNSYTIILSIHSRMISGFFWNSKVLLLGQWCFVICFSSTVVQLIFLISSLALVFTDLIHHKILFHQDHFEFPAWIPGACHLLHCNTPLHFNKSLFYHRGC